MQQTDRWQPLRILTIFILLTVLLIPLYSIPSRAARARLSGLRMEQVSGETPGMGLPQAYSCILPHEILPDAPAVMLRVLHSSVRVLLDGDVLYEHPGGRRDHIISLKKEDAGKTLTVTLTPKQELAFREPYPPLYGEYADIIRSIALYGLLPFLTAVLLAVYGVVFLALSLFLIPRVPAIRVRVYAALIMVISGIWMLCYHGFFELLSATARVVVLEFSMIYLAVPAYLACLHLMRLPLRRRAFLYTSLGIVLFTLAGAGVVMLTKTYASGFLLLYFLLCTIALLLTLIMFLRVRKAPDANPSLLVRLAGFCVYLITCLIHILCYFLLDYNGISRDVFTLNAITVGAAALLESQLVDYFLYASGSTQKQVERPELMEMAYRDFLTKLPNRTDAERVFERMAHSSHDFCLVMLDLNGLKKVNDESGHDAGDRLIVNFARVLRVAFGDGAYLARLGGDEFVAVLEGANAAYVNRHLQTLDEALLRLDAAEPDVRHSVSYGFAFRHECTEESRAAAEGETHPEPALRRASDTESHILQRVMALADTRMYAHKRLLKSGS